MTELKATEGPWVYHGHGTVYAKQKTGVHTSRLITIANGCSDDNAHLIAAAPQLYEALEEMVFAAQVHVFSPEENEPDRCRHCGNDIRDLSQHVSRISGDEKPFPTVQEIRGRASANARAALAAARGEE